MVLSSQTVQYRSNVHLAVYSNDVGRYSLLTIPLVCLMFMWRVCSVEFTGRNITSSSNSFTVCFERLHQQTVELVISFFSIYNRQNSRTSNIFKWCISDVECTNFIKTMILLSYSHGDILTHHRKMVIISVLVLTTWRSQVLKISAMIIA